MPKANAKVAIFASFLFLAASANATTLYFEGFAPPGSLTNVAGGYTEAGFTLTPSNASAAVFDAAYTGASFPGDPTSWFGFAGGNIITMTGPAPFSLYNLLIGPSTIGSGNTNFTIFADVFGGGTMTTTFNGLTTATLETLNWGNLSDVTFSTTTDSAIDNITVNPEPGTLLLLGAGLGALMFRRSRRGNDGAAIRP